MRADIHTHKQTTIVLEDSASITTSQTMADFAKGSATASWQTKVANLPCASETERANPAERTAGRRAARIEKTALYTYIGIGISPV